MADGWMDPGLCIRQARATDRGKRIKNVLEGLSWRRRELKVRGVCRKGVSTRSRPSCEENTRVSDLDKKNALN